MLVLHEVHQLKGPHLAEFESAYRDEVLTAVAKQDGARVLWYLNHAAGSGPSYQVVTLTALRDGAAWDEYTRRTTAGDLAGIWLGLDAWRHEARSKLLQPVHWSPMQEVALEDVPTDARRHGLSLYMEDTGWPTAPLDEYIDYWDTDYYRFMKEMPPERQLLQIQACFQTAYGSHLRPEAILMQKVMDQRALQGLLVSTARYEPDTWPGSYMHGALALRDQWESKLLRTSDWSPFS
jgi:hypothetical protein